MLAAVISGLAVAPAVQAGVVVETYAFTLGNFVNGYGSDPSPLSSITGKVTVKYDPTQFYWNDTTDITVQTWTAPGGTPVGFTTLPWYNEIWIGDMENGALYIYPGTDDFEIGLFTNDPGHPTFVPCADAAACGSAPPTAPAAGYTLAGYNGDLWIATTSSIAAIPEPNVWALLVLGLGGLGAAMRSKRGASAAARR